MIDIVAPVGYVPTAPTDDSATNTGSESAISGNFEDIDSLLANSHQEEKIQQPKRKSKSKRNSKNKPDAKLKLNQPTPSQLTSNTLHPKPADTSSASPSKATSANQRRSQEPSLSPSSQWDSEAARKKKRILQIATFALLGMIAIGIGVWALFSGGSVEKRNDTIVQKDPAAIQTADQEKLPSPVDIGNAGNSGDAINVTETNSSPPTSETSSVSPSELPPTAIVNNSARQSSPPPLEVNTPSNSAIPLNSASKNSTIQGDGTNKATTPLLANDATENTSTSEDTSPLIPSTKNSLGELSKILQGQGTSLKEIEDIAEIQKERALIGTPTYLIERPDRKELNTERQLAGELSGWKLDNVPLINAVSDLEMLTNVPVTFAPELFRDGSFDIARPITLKVEAITFRSALEKLLMEDGLTLQIKAMGVTITAPQNDEIITKSYPQNFCTSENSTSRLRDLIIAVTGITDWNDDEQYKLEVLPDSVSVSHRQNEQQQIADLLLKLNAAATYQTDPAAMQVNLLPLALKAEATLEKSPELKTRNPYQNSMRIGSLFRQVRQATNLITIIDWENLAKQGWYPNTIVPGRVAEPTNRQLLDQLGHSMEATTIVIGPDTVMLTTFENAGQQNDTEVYSVGNVIDNKMTAPQLDQLLTETLGVDQLTPPNAIVIYFAECKCLVAKAPQIVQRQLHSIVNEL